jgi:hypothetical protein
MLTGRTTMSTIKPPKTASWGVGRATPEAETRLLAGVAYCERIFMGQAEAQKALFKLTAILEAEEIPYALRDVDLHPFVRDKFKELWNAAQGEDPYRR